MQLNRLHIMSILLGLIMAIRFITPSYAFGDNCKSVIADMSVCAESANTCAGSASSCCCTSDTDASGEEEASENLGSCCCMVQNVPAANENPTVQAKVPTFRFDKTFNALLSVVILLTTVSDDAVMPVSYEYPPLAHSSRHILALHSILRI